MHHHQQQALLDLRLAESYAPICITLIKSLLVVLVHYHLVPFLDITHGEGIFHLSLSLDIIS